MPTSFTISVIIPVYNAARYLERAVASALEQPQTGEVILIEDCSPDNSLAICEKLAAAHPDKVRLLRHPDGKNHGAGPSRNVGIRAAQHPFIAFLDADDYYLPGRFDRDEEILMGDESIDGVYNALGVDILDEKGKKWWGEKERVGYKPPDLTTIADPPPPEDLFLEMGLLGSRGFFHLDALTVWRGVFDTVSYFSDLRLSQDTLLKMQLAAKCRLAGGVVDRPVAMRGVHGENRIQDTHGLRAARKSVFSALLAWAPSAGLTSKQSKTLYAKALRYNKDWPQLIKMIVSNPWMLLHPVSYTIALQWFFLRQYPDDPIIPGLFPNLRKRRAKRHG